LILYRRRLRELVPTVPIIPPPLKPRTHSPPPISSLTPPSLPLFFLSHRWTSPLSAQLVSILSHTIFRIESKNDPLSIISQTHRANLLLYKPPPFFSAVPNSFSSKYDRTDQTLFPLLPSSDPFSLIAHLLAGFSILTFLPPNPFSSCTCRFFSTNPVLLARGRIFLTLLTPSTP